MDLQLTGMIAVVTGASKGIGPATVRTLLDEGARVVAGSRRHTPELTALAADSLLHVPVDLMDPAAPPISWTARWRGSGGSTSSSTTRSGPRRHRAAPGRLLTPTDDHWRAMIEFNLLAPVSAIVNVSSTHAHVPSAINVDYGVANAGLNNLTQALSEEFGPQGIRVNTASPGPVRTPGWTDAGGAADVLAAMTGTDRDTLLDRSAAEMMNLTTGRLLDPQEIADMIVLLASPRSAGTTGSDVVVDAGLVKTV